MSKMSKMNKCKSMIKRLDRSQIVEAPNILAKWIVEYSLPFIKNAESVRDISLIPLDSVVHDFIDIQSMVSELKIYERSGEVWASLFPPKTLEVDCKYCLYIYFCYQASRNLRSIGDVNISVIDYSLGLFHSSAETYSLEQAISYDEDAMEAFFFALGEAHLKMTLQATITAQDTGLLGQRRL